MARAIETHYRGFRFRSRLEARWAVFMDALEVRWCYETEGYVLDRGDCYLPDFYLPTLNCYLEIKGDKPTAAQCDKTSRFACEIGKRVYLFYGEMADQIPANPYDSHIAADSAICFFTDGSQDTGYLWCECDQCRSVGIEYGGRSDRLPCKKTTCTPSVHGDRGYNFSSTRLLNAYHAAQAARFEHGENPAMEGRRWAAA